MQNQMAKGPATNASRTQNSAYRPRTAIIGAGAAGMMQAIKLREAGFDDLVIYEKANEVGGTWRENRYPGIACDVPAHHYNYSFEHNPGWSSGRKSSHTWSRSPTNTIFDAISCLAPR